MSDTTRVNLLVSMAQDSVKTILDRFATPPGSLRPAVYWFWFWNDIRADEITQQLEALHGQGIGAVEIRSICKHRKGSDNHAPGPGLEYLSPVWLDAFDHLLVEADRIGMEVGVNLGMGWCYGGPWIPDELRTRAAMFDGFAANGDTDLAKMVGELEIVQVARGAVDPNTGRPAQVPDWLRVYGWRITDVAAKAVDTQSLTDLSPQFRTEGGIVYTGKPLEGYWLIGVRAMVGGADPKHTEEATGGLGNSANPLSKEAITLQLDQVMGRIQARSGRHFGKSMRDLATDSWEHGWYIPYGLGNFVTVFSKTKLVPVEKRLGLWSPEFDREFATRKGYALENCLPGLLGYGGAQSLKEDIEEVRQQLFLENFFETITAWCRANGLRHRPQVYGPELQRNAAGWARSDMPDIEQEYLHLAAAFRDGAYGAGRPVLNMEAFTWWGDATLNDLRHGANYFFGCGVNRIQYHSWSYSPERAGIPGWQMYVPYHYHYNSPAFPYSHTINAWLARSQVLLQAGVPHLDVATLGRTAPEGLLSIALDEIPKDLFAETWRHGAVSIGTVLAAPGRTLDLPAEAGLGLTEYPQALPAPLFQVEVPRRGGESPAQPFLVRRLADGWILVVFNQVSLGQGRGTKITRPDSITTRVKTSVPHRSVLLLDPDTGRAFRLESSDDGLEIAVPPGEARYLLYTEHDTAVTEQARGEELRTLTNVAGPWKMERNLSVGVAGRLFPAEKAEMVPELKPWAEIPGLKGYAGTASCTAEFNLDRTEVTGDSVRYLQVGRVGQVAQVWINGIELGHLWHEPWRIEIPLGVLREQNTVRLDIANRYEDYTAADSTKDSGLAGPVTIQETVTLSLRAGIRRGLRSTT